MLLNAKNFPFSFFLGGHEVVESLEAGAVKNGGATTFKDKIISNVDDGEFINISLESNTLSILVPSTIDVDKEVDNTPYVKMALQKLAFYNESKEYYNTTGSWYSEDMDKVVVENVTAISVQFERKITSFDIMIFVAIARMLKKEMRQEGVSIYINEALAII